MRIFVTIQIKTTMEKVIKLENVDPYNNLYGRETLHPLVSIVELTKATKSVNHIQMNYGLYALFLKETRFLHKRENIEARLNRASISELALANKYLLCRIIIKCLFFKSAILMNNMKTIPFQI
jgi:hypothetical protein